MNEYTFRKESVSILWEYREKKSEAVSRRDVSGANRMTLVNQWKKMKSESEFLNISSKLI